MGRLSEDYITMDFKGGSFYYGYEVSLCSECGAKLGDGSETCELHEDADSVWCFEAVFNGVKTVAPYTELGTGDKFDMYGNLSAGVERFMGKLAST